MRTMVPKNRSREPIPHAATPPPGDREGERTTPEGPPKKELSSFSSPWKYLPHSLITAPRHRIPCETARPAVDRPHGKGHHPPLTRPLVLPVAWACISSGLHAGART